MHEAGDIMIKDNQKVLNRVHVVMDALITTISYALAYVIKFYIIDAKTLGVGVLPPKDYFLVLLFLVPAYVLLYYMLKIVQCYYMIYSSGSYKFNVEVTLCHVPFGTISPYI